MAVPNLRLYDDMHLHHGPPVFSRHDKLPGRHMLADDYAGLPETARQRLAGDLALFHAELHRIDPGRMAAAGARPIAAWQSVEAIRARALPLLLSALRVPAEAALAAFERLPPDPHGTVYGFFDGHGWNMAFDAARQRLNGIYDFADSGFGPLHQEFVTSSFVAPDLTARLASAYERLTGRALDRRHIAVLTGVHRLSELAELADDPDQVQAMVANVAAWVASCRAGMP